MIALAALSLLVAFSGAVVPGPLFAVTLQQALVVGWTAGVWLMIGHMLSELALVGCIRLGLGGVLQRPAVTRLIGLIGGAVMLFFAYSMFDQVLHWHPGALHGHAAMSTGTLIGQGMLLSVLNPYWLLWWATVGIGMISGHVNKLGGRAWVVFFLAHELADYLWYIGISLIVALGGTFLNATLHRGIIFTCGLGIAVLGILFMLKPLREWFALGNNKGSVYVSH